MIAKEMIFMTLRQEAYSLIDTLSDEGIRAVIHIMRMIPPSVSDVKGDGISEKMKAYNNLQLLRQETAKYNITDFDAERDSALTAKYGKIS